jgi:hypothetical protein
MANINTLELDGELIGLGYYCSDYCAKQSEHYTGWYGCVELYTPEVCQTCDKALSWVEEATR